MAKIEIRKSFLVQPLVLVILLLTLYFATGSRVRMVLWEHSIPVVLTLLFLTLAYSVGMKILRRLQVYPDDLFPIAIQKQGEHWVPAGPEEQADWRKSFGTMVREVLSWEKACFAIGLGYGVLAYGALFLALIGQLNKVGVLIMLGLFAFCVPGEVKWLYRYQQIPVEWRRRGENPKRGFRKSLRTVLWILIVIPVVLSFFSALAPPHQSDALRYHLAVPALFVQEGGWVDLRDNAFSHFPFTIEMLYALGLVFDQDVACRLIHFSFFVLTLIGLYSLSRRLQSSSAGLLSSAIFATTPFIPILSSWAFIEMGMTFYSLLCFYALVLWFESQFQRRKKKGWLGPYQLELCPNRLAVLTGVYCGLAMSVKYTALFLALFVFVVMLGTAIFFVLWGRFAKRPYSGLRSHLRFRGMARRAPTRLSLTSRNSLPPYPLPVLRFLPIFYFTLAGFLVFSPWLLKNLWLTGNPLFPFLNRFFESPYWSRFEAAFYAFHAGQKGGLNEVSRLGGLEQLRDFITLPWRATVQPLGGWPIGPLYFVFALVLLFFVKKIPRPIKLTLSGSAFLFIVWAYTYRDNRFLLPVLALMALSFGHVFARLWHRPNRQIVFALYVLLFLLIYNCTSLIFSFMVENNAFPVVMGKQSREEFLSDRLDYYPAFRFLNSNVRGPYSQKVLMVGEYRPYYCWRSYIANDWFNQPVIIRLLRENQTLPELVQNLKSENVRYVLLNELELSKGGYDFFFKLHFLPEQEAILFLERLKQIQNRQEAEQLKGELEFRLAIDPLYQRYREFLFSDQYLERIYPEGPEQALEIRVYRLK